LPPFDRWRRLLRYRRIVQLLLTHGIVFAAAEAAPARLWARARRQPTDASAGVHLRRLLADLGPTFVKLGQLFSTRPDLVPADVVRELEQLQDRVPPEPASRVRAVIEGELGAPVETLYRTFEWTPIAAASLGQVHRATLADGRRVVVKVQRPGVEPTVNADLEILGDALRILARMPALRDLYDPDALVAEFARGIRAELDYDREARNADRLRRSLPTDSRVVIPHIEWTLTRRRVLTMEAFEGLKPTDPRTVAAAGHDPREVARLLAHAILRMVFRDGFFHADPHPGNLIVLADGRLGLLDFGMVGRLTEPMREAFGNLSISLLRGDADAVVSAIVAMGAAPPDLDRDRLTRDVEDLRDRYYEVALHEVNLAQIVQDVFGLAFRYRVRIPMDYTLLGKCLVTLEGVIQILDPELSMVELARPFGATLMRERLSPTRVAARARRGLRDWERLLDTAPRDAGRVLARAARGELTVRLTEGDAALARSRRRQARSATLGRAGLAASLLSATTLLAAAIRPALVPSDTPTLVLAAVATVLFWLAARAG